jgi:hypothetical protein
MLFNTPRIDKKQKKYKINVFDYLGYLGIKVSNNR